MPASKLQRHRRDLPVIVQNLLLINHRRLNAPLQVPTKMDHHMNQKKTSVPKRQLQLHGVKHSLVITLRYSGLRTHRVLIADLDHLVLHDSPPVLVLYEMGNQYLAHPKKTLMKWQ